MLKKTLLSIVKDFSDPMHCPYIKGKGVLKFLSILHCIVSKIGQKLLLSRNEIVSKFPFSVYPLFHRSESHMLACHPLILGYLRVNIFKNLDLHTCKSGYVIFLLSDLIYFWSCYLLNSGINTFELTQQQLFLLPCTINV